MAYPHKDEMVWLAVRWWWFLGAQNGGSSLFQPDSRAVEAIVFVEEIAPE